jgi:hypothetical protein
MKVQWAVVVAAIAGSWGCAMSRPVPADVRVPSDVLRGSSYTSSGEPARSRYVVRMTDGTRDWEIQLPEIATAYEVSVPLSGKPATPLGVDLATLTAADREMLADRNAAAQGPGAEPPDAEGDGPKLVEAAAPSGKGARREPAKDEDDDVDGARFDAKAKAGKRPAPASEAPHGSYLLTLARVKDLYRSRHYELAQVEIVELEKQYPGDERILSMKGSLYERMGNKNLARDAWQQVLAVNPFNLAVLEALRRLGK